MNENANEIKWIGTLGGPLILMERAAVVDWMGDLGNGAGLGACGSDYERASDVRGWVGSIEVGDKRALVLSMPNETARISIDSKTVLLVRWIWGEGLEQMQEVLLEFDINQRWINTGVEIEFQSGDLVLFDSVYEGGDIPDLLSIDVDPGVYDVATLSYEPNSQVNLFFVKLKSKVVAGNR